MEGAHQPREYHRSQEEAKQAAAHYTLMALGVNWDGKPNQKNFFILDICKCAYRLQWIAQKKHCW